MDAPLARHAVGLRRGNTRLQRIRGPARLAPFPVHEGLVERLLAAHASPDVPRDEVLAHALGCCAGYAYADLDTVVTIASRVGLEECAEVRLTQVVDAMLVFSTAYLLQSRCGAALQPEGRVTELGDRV